MRRSNLLISVAGLAAFVACIDATGPDPGAQALDGLAPWVRHLNTEDGSQLNILAMADDSPRLEKYQATFKACKSKSQTLQIGYLPKPDVVAGLFLELEVPRYSLHRWPNGAYIASWQCVWITATIDPDNMVVKFEPEGLQFRSSRPATLRMWYTYANLDLNGDGVVDHEDEDIIDEDLALWRLPHDGGAWEKIGSVHYESAMQLKASLTRFSHYAVAH